MKVGLLAPFEQILGEKKLIHSAKMQIIDGSVSSAFGSTGSFAEFHSGQVVDTFCPYYQNSSDSE